MHLLAAAIVLLAETAAAEPYMALREGYTCADCHTNRSGGGMRTLLVEMHGSDILHLPNDGHGILPEVDERFSPNINRYLSVGTDFRLVDKLLFQDDPNASGKVDNNTAFRELDSHNIKVEQATLYGEVRLIPDYLSFYVDEQVAPGGASNREIFGLLGGVLPFDTYIKAGQFFAPWGLKVQDDDAFVSKLTGFNFDNNITGLEIGRTGEGLNVFASVADGADDNDTDPLLVGNGFYMWTGAGPFTSLMLGGSAAWESPGDDEFGAFTAYGGLSLGPLVLLGQGVFLDTEVDGNSTDSWIVYGEANYLMFGWLNAKFAFDWADPDTDVSDNNRNRFSFGFEPFLDQFLQLRLFYRVENGPEDVPNLNRDTLTLEAHLFF